MTRKLKVYFFFFFRSTWSAHYPPHQRIFFLSFFFINLEICFKDNRQNSDFFAIFYLIFFFYLSFFFPFFLKIEIQTEVSLILNLKDIVNTIFIYIRGGILIRTLLSVGIFYYTHNSFSLSLYTSFEIKRKIDRCNVHAVCLNKNCDTIYI